MKKRKGNENKLVSLGYIMGRIHTGIRKNVQRHAEECGFDNKFEHMIVLRILSMHGEKMPQSQLLDFLPVFDRHRLSRMCVEMEEMGFIKRISNPENRRENLLVLSDKGWRTIEQFKTLAQEANPEVFLGISETDQKELFRILQQILDNLEGKRANS